MDGWLESGLGEYNGTQTEEEGRRDGGRCSWVVCR